MSLAKCLVNNLVSVPDKFPRYGLFNVDLTKSVVRYFARTLL